MRGVQGAEVPLMREIVLKLGPVPNRCLYFEQRDFGQHKLPELLALQPIRNAQSKDFAKHLAPKHEW